MQVDTLYLTREELQTLHFDGAKELPQSAQGALRLFLDTLQATEDRCNRAAAAQGGPTGPGGEPAAMFKARVHIHFVVEPA